MSAVAPLDYTSVPGTKEVLDAAQRLLELLRRQVVADSTTSLSAPTRRSILLSDSQATTVWLEAVLPTKSAPELLDEVKDASGLTWDQIARLMGVSRRSVHLWLSGRPLSAENEERLHTIREIVRSVGGRSQVEVRSKLLDKSGGASVLDLLAAGDDANATTLARDRAVAAAAPMLFTHIPRRLDTAQRSRRASIGALDALEEGGVVEVTPTRLKRARRMRRKDGS